MFTFYKSVDTTAALTPLVPKVTIYVVSESTTLHLRDVYTERIPKEKQKLPIDRVKMQEEIWKTTATGLF